MKRTFIITVLAFVLSAGSAFADCVAEYKAKRDNPTEYLHSTMPVPSEFCSAEQAQSYVAQELSKEGWTLLAIVNVTNG